MGLQFPVFLFLISLSKFGIGPYVSYWFPVSFQASDKGPFINSIMEQFSFLVARRLRVKSISDWKTA
jgi:hypothetical protein